MAFTSICPTNAVSEGGMGLFQAGRKSVLPWPTGGELKAYPHADVPLTDATFNGRTVTCPHHQWGFDGSTSQVQSSPSP